MTQMETTDFAQCISSCDLTEFPFTGSLYTWWNGRTAGDSVFKRLDRVFGNEIFWQECNQSVVLHMVRDGSDHAPLHVTCKTGHSMIRKPFRFLNFWTNHISFRDVVSQSWEMPCEGSPFHRFNEKLKRLRTVLIKWSKSTYGDFF